MEQRGTTMKTLFSRLDFDAHLRLYGIPIGAVFEAFSDVLAAGGLVFHSIMHPKERRSAHPKHAGPEMF